MKCKPLILWDFIFGTLLVYLGISYPNKIGTCILIAGGILHYVFAFLIIHMTKIESSQPASKESGQ